MLNRLRAYWDGMYEGVLLSTHLLYTWTRSRCLFFCCLVYHCVNDHLVF